MNTAHNTQHDLGDPLSQSAPRPRYSVASPRELLYMVFRHKRKAGTFAAVVLLLLVGAALLLPSIYRSESKLLVRLGRESVVLDPSASIGQTVSPQVNRESEIRSELEILRSRAIAERVVQRLTADYVLGRTDQPGEKLEPMHPRFVQAVLEVEREIDVSVVPESSVLSVAIGTKSAQRSQAIVQAYVDCYLTLRATVFRDPESERFFREQGERARAVLLSIEEQVRELKTVTGVASLEDQRPILLNRIGQIQRDIDETRASAAATEAASTALERRLLELPKTVVTETTTGSPMGSLDALRAQVNALRLEEQDALLRFLPTSPRVTMIREKIVAAEKMLADAEAKIRQETVGLNQTYEELSRRLEGERANLASYAARIAALSADMERAQTGLALLNDVEVKIRQLSREAGIAEANVRRYASTYEQARVEGALEAGKVSNISVVQPATLPLRPSSPNRLLLLALGVFLAITGAFGVAFGAEALDNTIKRPDDVARLGLSSTVSLPLITYGPSTYDRIKPILQRRAKQAAEKTRHASKVVAKRARSASQNAWLRTRLAAQRTADWSRDRSVAAVHYSGQYGNVAVFSLRQMTRRLGVALRNLAARIAFVFRSIRYRAIIQVDGARIQFHRLTHRVSLKLSGIRQRVIGWRVARAEAARKAALQRDAESRQVQDLQEAVRSGRILRQRLGLESPEPVLATVGVAEQAEQKASSSSLSAVSIPPRTRRAKPVLAQVTFKEDDRPVIRPLPAKVGTNSTATETSEPGGNEHSAVSSVAEPAPTPVLVTAEASELSKEVVAEVAPPKIEPRLLAAARDIVDRIVAEDTILFTGPGRVIGVIGARQGQGATTVAGYLAKALAERLESMGEDAGDDRVLLVDTDVAHPTAHERFDVPVAPGLSEWLKAGGAEGQGHAHLTEHARLSVLSAGGADGVAILPERFRRITHALANQYRFVVIDLPALSEGAAAARLAGVCRDVLFVIESGSLHEEAARQSLEQLRHCGVNVIGVALNKREFPIPQWLYRHS